MATLRQLAANRRNALASTGPTTDEGKAASRRNALKHGLAGEGVVLPDEERDAVDLRLGEWRDSFRPAGGEEQWLFEQVVVHSVRLDRCQAEEAGLRTHLARRASLCWDDDRRLDAEETAARLARDPARVARRLQATRQGCDWMIERWEALAAREAWTEAQTSLALDLLGVPHELRDGRVDAPRETAAREARRLRDRRAETLDDLDEAEQHLAETGVEVRTPKALALLRRYEAACLRRLQWAKSRLERSRANREADRETEPGAEPSSRVTPEGRIQVLSTPPPPPPPTDEDYRAFEADLFRQLLTAPDEPTAVHAPASPEPARLAAALNPIPLSGNRKMRRAAQRMIGRGR